MYQLYTILYCAALIFLLPFEFFKRPKSLRKRWIRERLGFCGPEIQSSQSLTMWVHAVSVGEAIASVPLIKKLKSRYPHSGFVISTVTDTGQKVAAERLGDIAKIIYVPFDLPFAVKNTFRRTRPSIFIIMETELWPNIIKTSDMLNVPVLLMNGRISEKSFNGYKSLRFFIHRVMSYVSFFCMQDEVYAERVKALGAGPQRVSAIGSFKFDTKPSSPAPEWTCRLKGPVIIAGSTHRTEEELLIDAYIKLRVDFSDLNLIIAPRHPERFKEVEELIRKKGLEYTKRSEMIKQENAAKISGTVVLLDVIGELSSVYGACDIAVMGGTFIEHGGQNPLEPAYWGKAIVCGPHMENFPFMDEFYRDSAAVKVEAGNLHGSLGDLLASSERMESMGKAARTLYEKNAGATDRAIEIIEKYL